MRLAILLAAAPVVLGAKFNHQSRVHARRKTPDDDTNEEYEYGDVEAHAADADTSDYSVHQFIAKDEARDPMGSDDTEEDAAANDAARSAILSREETFGSEDEPSPDNFLQQKSHRFLAHKKMLPASITEGDAEGAEEEEYEYGDVEAHSGEEDGSDYSIHQFIAKDEARDPEGSDDSEADAASMDAQRSAIEAREAPFDSEDEPSPDNFFQKNMKRMHKKMLPASITEGDAEGAEEEEYEYGDVEAHSGEEDGSDYSIHQFIAKDEARDPEGSDDSEADAASMDAQRSAIEAREAPFDSEDEPSPDNFFQKNMQRTHKKMLPASITEGDAEGAEEEEYEYGDVEAHSGEEDGSDYSIHQFIAKDEARDPEGSDDSEADAASMDAQRSAIEAREAPFDSEDEPSPDNFLQRSMKRTHKKMLPASITEGDAEGAEEEEYEYGDVEAHSGEEDGSDYSIHQFIAKDEARDPEGSDDSEADAASMDAQRSAIEAREAPFDSEDEPSPDNFLQKRMQKAHKKMLPASITEGDAEGAEEEEYEYGDVEAHSGEEDGSDYSIHQFIAKDEARDPEGSDDSEADAASMDAQRSAIEAREAPFDSEDEPSPDNFLQKRMHKAHKKMLPASITEGDAEGAEEEEYEYGDVEAHSGEEDGSDYSIHQFIAKDEARDPEGSDDSEADAASMDAQRSAIEAREAPFDSEDEPSPDNFLQKKMQKAHKKMLPASITEGDAEGAEEEEYEYGDVEAHSGEEDGSDYSIHQFIAKDEARDPEGSDDSEADAASMDAQRSAIEAREAPFDSEDEPSPDNFLQKRMKRAHKKMLPASITEGDAEGAEEEEYEYGDVEAHSGEEDGSDYSIHQFIAKDEARDPEGSDDSEADAASMDAQRSAIEAREAPFDSEDEPSPDN